MENLECHLICSRCECDTKKFASDCPISCYTILNFLTLKVINHTALTIIWIRLLWNHTVPTIIWIRLLWKHTFPTIICIRLLWKHTLPTIIWIQGWEFAHSLIAHSLIHSFAHSLILLKKNERPWANCSGRSEEMSDREQFAQVAQDKWATVSKSAQKKWANERFAQKMLAKKV